MSHYSTDHSEQETIQDTMPQNDKSTKAKKYILPYLPTLQKLKIHPNSVERYAFWGVFLLAALLRFWGLGSRPLHFDESQHATYALVLLRDNLDHWKACVGAPLNVCYRYNPLTHGPFQFHIIALVYKLSQWLGASEHGINTTTVRIAAATLGTLLVSLPYFLRNTLGKIGAWLACFLLATSPSMVYFSRFAREDIYMACFTLLLVVAVIRYMQTRRFYWLVTAVCALTLSYATKEATFLTIAVFGSFTGAALVWELGVRRPLRYRPSLHLGKYLHIAPPRTAAPLLVLAYFALLGAIAQWLIGWLHILTQTITKNPTAANAYVEQLKLRTEFLLPWLGMIIALVSFVFLLHEQLGHTHTSSKRRARHLDPDKQPLLTILVTTSWIYWFLALMCGCFLFAALFSDLFTYLPNGIGDGIWQGLYYWLGQQQVARGGQPWYYYLLLIPLYEQIGLVFGIIGVIRCLLHPTRMRLFLVYWFIGNLVLYSWAGEKMPWLMIHVTLPMLILAAIGLEPTVTRIYQTLMAPNTPGQLLHVTAIVEEIATIHSNVTNEREGSSIALPPHPSFWDNNFNPRTPFTARKAMYVLSFSLLLLLVTTQNMVQVSYIHQADSSREMMVYVQTTPDVNKVMQKIQTLDQDLYQGKHQVTVGVAQDASWPFSWYLRDYTHVCYNFPAGCANNMLNPQVIITGKTNTNDVQMRYGMNYISQPYHLFDQWDQGYMLPSCKITSKHPCPPQQFVGVGPLLWLSYGDVVPTGAQFNPLLAIQHIWQWWWQRKPIGSVSGGGFTGMTLFIRSDLPVTP